MHIYTLDRWRHSHTFGTEAKRSGEQRTWWVIGLTVTMMIAEITAGTLYGSMALLADGWHMGTHAAALGITVFAYIFARRNADNPHFSFGTGKVGDLGGFASAVGLAVVALLVFAESVHRMVTPVAIHFNEAIFVAVIGLIVNIVSAIILRDEHNHEHGNHHHQHHDNNLRGAYLHVLADATTSVFAIAALLAGRQFGWVWMDPMMGIVGSLVIASWSIGLLKDTSKVLLDAEGSEALRNRIRESIEADADNRVSDLHLWRVGSHHMAAIISVVTHAPRDPDHYKRLIQDFEELAHVTIEVNPCKGETCVHHAS